MYSIEQFCEKENSIWTDAMRRYGDLMEHFLVDCNYENFVHALSENGPELMCQLAGFALTTVNNAIRESDDRKENWYVERTVVRHLTSCMGQIEFEDTYYQNLHTGKYEYLLDRKVGLRIHEDVLPDAEEEILRDVVNVSYEKSGGQPQFNVSRQTVMNIMKKLQFPEEPAPETKKKVKFLYIDADEDHDSLQFFEKKGDIGKEKDKNGRCARTNTLINRIAYTYEGVEPDAPESTRHHLVNPHYFCGVYKNAGDLWDEVYKYITDNYESQGTTIFLNGDGGAWIRSGAEMNADFNYVLDEFHLQKYLNRIVRGTKEEAEAYKNLLLLAISEDNKADFNKWIMEISTKLPADTNMKKFQEDANYILNNWEAACRRLKHDPGIVGCSAEAHVSHVLASRMSSRPMGWSRNGADQMAHLIAYTRNNRSLEELVRYTHEQEQKELPMAAGAESEYDCLSCTQVLASEHSSLNGKFYDSIQGHVNEAISGQLWFKELTRFHL